MKETSYEEYFFDLSQIQLLPVSELIIFGTEKVLERKNITIPHPCVCWIDIYQVNGLAIMVPIVHEVNATRRNHSTDDIIVINPFGYEIQ